MARSTAYLFGRLAGRQFRKAKWMWDSVAGAEDDAIRAQQGLGREMAVAVREQAPAPADPGVQTTARRAGARRWPDRVRNPVHRFEVAAVAGDHPTAFALPGGYYLRGLRPWSSSPAGTATSWPSRSGTRWAT